MVKVIEKSYAGLIREEKDGSYLCIPTSINKPIFINKTLHEIFKICNHKSIKEIVDYMADKYPSEPIERILEGVTNGIWFLRNIGVICISGDDKMRKQNGEKMFTMPDECDFEEISRMILALYDSKNDKVFWYADGTINREKRNDIKYMCKVESLRYGHATECKIIYKYSCECSFDIDGIVSFCLHKSRRVAYINMLVAKDYDIAQDIISELKKVLIENRVWNLKCLFSDRKIDGRYIDYFKEMGFIEEALLSDESIYGDLHVYSLKTNCEAK